MTNMLNLELALRINNIPQRQFAASIDFTEPEFSEIVSGKKVPSEAKKDIITKALGVKMSKEKLFSKVDLGPRTKEYISAFKARKLAPQLQAQVDAAVAIEVAKIKAQRATEPGRLLELAKQTAGRHFR